MSLSNYPPGVTGNEPHLTGEYPCSECDGAGGDFDEDGGHACPRCKGRGIEPEEFDPAYLEDLADRRPTGYLLDDTLSWVRACEFDRRNPDDRRILRAATRLRRQERGL